MIEGSSDNRHQIGGRRLAIFARFDIEIDTLALAQCAEPGEFHGTDMDEHVLGPIFRRDEAVAFTWDEPLNGSCWHPNSR